MQSPAPASSLAEPPPAASPQLGWWICQQGLRSARIRGVLLLLAASAAAAAAAAAASTTPALTFLRLVTFRTGIIKFSYRVSNVYVYVVHGFLHCHLLVVYVLLLHPVCSKSVWPGLLWRTWMDANTP